MRSIVRATRASILLAVLPENPLPMPFVQAPRPATIISAIALRREKSVMLKLDFFVLFSGRYCNLFAQSCHPDCQDLASFRAASGAK